MTMNTSNFPVMQISTGLQYWFCHLAYTRIASLLLAPLGDGWKLIVTIRTTTNMPMV